MWNLERNIWEFELRLILIIISYGLMRIEKKKDGLQVIYTAQRSQICHNILI
jgi:hypothetical protein